MESNLVWPLGVMPLLPRSNIHNDMTWKCLKKSENWECIGLPIEPTKQRFNRRSVDDRMTKVRSLCPIAEIVIFRINETIFRKMDGHETWNLSGLCDVICLKCV
jgi:hypothetical protein